MSEIRLLMATHAGLHEVRIGAEKGECSVTRLFSGHWHGLTKLQNSYLGFRRPPFGEDRHAWSEAYEINADLTKRVRFGGAALRGLDGVHQAIAADGGIYITETGNNRLLFWDSERAEREEWPWTEHLFGGTAFDRHHPNSLCWLQPQIVLVLLHNREYGPAQIARVELSREKQTFDVTDLLDLPSDHAHDLHRESEFAIVYLDSIEGEIVRTSDESGLTRTEIGGYTKALARTEDLYIIGSNEFSDRTDRADAEGELVVVDAGDLTVRSRFDAAPEDADVSGNINDLLQIGGDNADGS